MGFYTELEPLNLEELKQRFEHDGDYDDYYEEIASHIAAQGELGFFYLKKIIEEAHIAAPQLRATILILSAQPPEQWYRQRLQTLLQNPQEFVVAAAVDALASIGASDLSAHVLNLQAHASPYVRGSVLRYMSRLFPDEAPPMLLAALKDAHPIVRENALDELDNLGYYQALPDIRPFLYHQPDHVYQAALSAVKHWTVLRKEASSTSPGKNGQ